MPSQRCKPGCSYLDSWLGGKVSLANVVIPASGRQVLPAHSQIKTLGGLRQVSQSIDLVSSRLNS